MTYRTVAEVVARAAEVRSELEELDNLDILTEEQEVRFDELVAEIDTLAETRAKLEARDAARARVADIAKDEKNMERGFDVPNVQVKRDPFDLSEIRGLSRSELRSRALEAVERVESDTMTDANRAEVERKLRNVRDDRGVIPGLILHTGSDAYRSAFMKGLAGRSDLWTSEERNAVAAAEEFRASMSLTDANGGYGVPFTLDPTLILTNDGAVSPVRNLARVETITTDTWNGLSSAGVTASFDAELAEVSDDSPTFAQPSVTVRKAQAFVQGSIEITQDFRGLESDVMAMLADGKARLEASVFINGASGSNQPIGIITALDGGSSEVAPGTAETFAVGDIYKTQQALPARWRSAGSRVAWIAELSTINLMRQFGTANNYHGFLVDLGGGAPSQLLGYPLYEDSNMDAGSAINPAATADNHILVIGDWRNYLIVDRVGMSVEFIPHLFNTTTNLPDGRRGWYAYWRVGADSLVDGAFRVLNVATTA
jgi:HK97 family phage major capsid protein